jgi:hypothetical protein
MAQRVKMVCPISPSLAGRCCFSPFNSAMRNVTQSRAKLVMTMHESDSKRFVMVYLLDSPLPAPTRTPFSMEIPSMGCKLFIIF